MPSLHAVQQLHRCAPGEHCSAPPIAVLRLPASLSYPAHPPAAPTFPPDSPSPAPPCCLCCSPAGPVYSLGRVPAGTIPQQSAHTMAAQPPPPLPGQVQTQIPSNTSSLLRVCAALRISCDPQCEVMSSVLMCQ